MPSDLDVDGPSVIADVCEDGNADNICVDCNRTDVCEDGNTTDPSTTYRFYSCPCRI